MTRLRRDNPGGGASGAHGVPPPGRRMPYTATGTPSRVSRVPRSAPRGAGPEHAGTSDAEPRRTRIRNCERAGVSGGISVQADNQ